MQFTSIDGARTWQLDADQRRVFIGMIRDAERILGPFQVWHILEEIAVENGKRYRDLSEDPKCEPGVVEWYEVAQAIENAKEYDQRPTQATSQDPWPP
jgi:hypothetical protein